VGSVGRTEELGGYGQAGDEREGANWVSFRGEGIVLCVISCSWAVWWWVEGRSAVC
jgi:hypothetical protein